jgi:hypothetical protein
MLGAQWQARLLMLKIRQFLYDTPALCRGISTFYAQVVLRNLYSLFNSGAVSVVFYPDQNHFLNLIVLQVFTVIKPVIIYEKVNRQTAIQPYNAYQS